MPNLTDHFTLAEMIASDIATRRHIDNTPARDIVENLTRTAQVLEQVRALLGSREIFVRSGYRSPELNRMAGGSNNPASPIEFESDGGRANDFEGFVNG